VDGMAAWGHGGLAKVFEKCMIKSSLTRKEKERWNLSMTFVLLPRSMG
jgi:hypothetical protein